jgi:hypothetical protein
VAFNLGSEATPHLVPPVDEVTVAIGLERSVAAYRTISPSPEWPSDRWRLPEERRFTFGTVALGASDTGTDTLVNDGANRVLR